MTCQHDWWTVPDERWKSNPEKITVFCAKCEEQLMAKVLNHWTEIEKVVAAARSK